jgi:peptidoglycan hydrolase-like protein with peptidoglycan-binding domain
VPGDTVTLKAQTRGIVDGAGVDFEIVDVSHKPPRTIARLNGRSRNGWATTEWKVDGMDGPRTQAGVRAFQDEYNTRFDESIAVDGAIGPRTWGAMFDVMRSLVQEAFAQRTGAREMPSLTYGC